MQIINDYDKCHFCNYLYFNFLEIPEILIGWQYAYGAHGRAVKFAVHNISWMIEIQRSWVQTLRVAPWESAYTTSSGRPEPCEGIWVVSKGS